jgi:hypothetical protein
MLTGVTYNVFLGRTFEPLFEWLFVQCSPQDFYCFQEFPEHSIQDLKVYLDKSGYDFQFTPGFVRYGITYGELTAFNKSKLKLLHTKTISLGGRGERNVVFTHNGLRLFRIDETEIDKSALLTHFQYKHRDFTLVNAHLSADLHNSRKLKQLEIILGALSTTEPAIILGDFNYPVGKRKLARVMSRRGLKSELQNQKTFRFASGIYWQNDYIFRKGCTIKEVTVKKVQYSDHYPIFFTVEV